MDLPLYGVGSLRWRFKHFSLSLFCCEPLHYFWDGCESYCCWDRGVRRVEEGKKRVNGVGRDDTRRGECGTFSELCCERGERRGVRRDITKEGGCGNWVVIYKWKAWPSGPRGVCQQVGIRCQGKSLGWVSGSKHWTLGAAHSPGRPGPTIRSETRRVCRRGARGCRSRRRRSWGSS